MAANVNKSCLFIPHVFNGIFHVSGTVLDTGQRMKNKKKFLSFWILHSRGDLKNKLNIYFLVILLEVLIYVGSA